MNKLLIMSVILTAFFGCTSPKNVADTTTSEKKILIDSSDYQIIIIDPDFDRWYQLRFNPGVDKSEAFYRSKNIFAVNRWNDYYLRGKYRRAIGSNINYNPNTEYGPEVNRKLYWYFKYIEENYGVPLLK